MVFPEFSLYRDGKTFRIDADYANSVNLDLIGESYSAYHRHYVIDADDSYTPLVNAIKAVQALAQKHAVTVVLNTVPQKVYPDLTRYDSLPQSIVTNSALIIGPDGVIKDVDMKVSTNFDYNDSPQTALAMESKKIRYFK